MDIASALMKRRWLTSLSALIGLVIATALFVYFETDPPPSDPVALGVAAIGFFLCPGSLLSVAAIDIEPKTLDFVVMWLVVAAINFTLYGTIGEVVGRSWWKSD
jgi:hypothetical protein